MTKTTKKITIIGGGQWGRTLGLLLSKNAVEIAIWDIRETLVEELKEFYESMRNAGHDIVSEPHFENSLGKSLDKTDLVFIAVGSTNVRDVAIHLAELTTYDSPTIIATKGFDEHRGKIAFLSDVVLQEYKKQCIVGVLSGPNLSKEIQAKHPAVSLIASESKELIAHGMELLASPLFRIYGSDDIKGVQIGGAVKNVIALAGGMVDELGFEYNTKAALLTRGLVEIIRLGTKLGGQKDTFAGISGLGDLICTAFSPSSRNYRAGRMFGKGMMREEIIAKIGEVVEGIETARLVKKLSEREQVEMPISQGVYRVVWDCVEPLKVIHELMTRGLKFE